jgi:hypothetical protein
MLHPLYRLTLNQFSSQSIFKTRELIIINNIKYGRQQQFYVRHKEINNNLMIFSGPNTIEHFLKQFIELKTECIKYLKLNIKMKNLNLE